MSQNEKQNEQWLDDLITQAIGSKKLSFDPEQWKQKYLHPSSMPLRLYRFWFWQTTLTRRKLTLGMVAAILTAGVIIFWPSSPILEKGAWWLEPSAALGQEILVSLEKVEGMIYRQQLITENEYGRTEVNSYWEKRFNANGKYRRDLFTGNQLMTTEWLITDGNDLIKTEVAYDLKGYWVNRETGRANVQGNIDRLRFYVKLLDKADRVFGTGTFEGKTCVGFEIKDSKFGSNSQDGFHRIWFDTKTKLPVRVEEHGLPPFNAAYRQIIVHDQFEYFVVMPADIFVPKIPQGFVNAPMDQLRADKEKEQKGEMVFTEVPPQWKNEVDRALKAVKTAGYRRYLEFFQKDGSLSGKNDLTKYVLSSKTWRIDQYMQEKDTQPVKTEWYVVTKEKPGDTSFAARDKTFFITQTNVDFNNRTWMRKVHTSDNSPRNPLEWLMFLTGMIDKADRILENTNIDGIPCFGVEIKAKKYGDNPDYMVHRLWFDMGTKLPVRMEWETRAGKDGQGQKMIEVKDQFQWNDDFSADTLNPVIPEGYLEK